MSAYYVAGIVPEILYICKRVMQGSGDKSLFSWN